MDELELLKKDWKKQEKELPKLSYNDIYKMILKRSSSIVKWIFIISLLEFVLWSSIDIIARLTGKYEEMKILGLEGFSMITSVLSYGILVYFIIRFYLNYKNIRTTDSASVLMKNILSSRKTVRQYVWVNISFLAITIIIVTVYMTFFTDTYTHQSTNQDIPIYLVILSTIIVLALVIGVLMFFYRLVYGILTRRLKKNYQELQKLEY